MKIIVTFFLQDGWSPLHFATMNGFADIAIIILKKKANVNCLDKVSLNLIIDISKKFQNS